MEINKVLNFSAVDFAIEEIIVNNFFDYFNKYVVFVEVDFVSHFLIKTH